MTTQTTTKQQDLRRASTVLTIHPVGPNGKPDMDHSLTVSESDVRHMLHDIRKRAWPRPLLGVPVERTIRDQAFLSFMRLQGTYGYDMVQQDYTRCDIARNRMAMELLSDPDDRWTHLVMLDSDHVHPAGVVQQLMARVKEEPDRLVVAGLNFRRGPNYDPLVYVEKEDGETFQPAEWEPDRLMTAERLIVGTGTIIIAKEVFQRMYDDDPSRPFFGYDYTNWYVDKWPGVDIYFCRRCHEIGVQIYCDPLNTSPHIGDRMVDGDTWHAHMDNHPALLAESEETRNMDLSGDMTEQQQINGWLQERKAVMSDLLADVWEADEPLRVLYVGANKRRFLYGTELYRAGHSIDVLEIFRPYATGLRDDKRVRRVILGDVTKAEDMPVDEYDLAIWWHGPEHIASEDIVAAVANLESVVKEGGRVVIGCPWGLFAEGPCDGNPHQAHVSTWYEDDFRGLGYDVTTTGEMDTPYSGIIAIKQIDGG